MFVRGTDDERFMLACGRGRRHVRYTLPLGFLLAVSRHVCDRRVHNKTQIF